MTISLAYIFRMYFIDVSNEYLNGGSLHRVQSVFLGVFHRRV